MVWEVTLCIPSKVVCKVPEMGSVEVEEVDTEEGEVEVEEEVRE
jgi:hypothetical protein